MKFIHVRATLRAIYNALPSPVLSLNEQLRELDKDMDARLERNEQSLDAAAVALMRGKGE